MTFKRNPKTETDQNLLEKKCKQLQLLRKELTRTEPGSPSSLNFLFINNQFSGFQFLAQVVEGVLFLMSVVLPSTCSSTFLSLYLRGPYCWGLLLSCTHLQLITHILLTPELSSRCAVFTSIKSPNLQLPGYLYLGKSGVYQHKKRKKY